MLIEDSFTVRAPRDGLWRLLQDVERIAPCLPGAELTETVDDRTWKGKVHVAFGPVQLAFAGTVRMEERDDAEHRARLSAKGTEQRGRGAASATVESWLEPADGDGTTVHLRSDITITGAAAQLSRGLLPEISRVLTRQFADCLRGTIESAEQARSGGRGGTATTASAAVASPRAIGAIGLGLRAVWATVRRLVARLFGRRGAS